MKVKVQSKIGSLDNVKHKPGGGDKKVFNDVEYMRQVSDHAVSITNASGPGSLTSSRRESSSQVNSQKIFKRPICFFSSMFCFLFSIRAYCIYLTTKFVEIAYPVFVSAWQM